MKRFVAVLAVSLLAHASMALAAGGWTDNFPAALAQAKAENKPVLINFTGSDWCGWCIKLQNDVFSTPAFKKYAESNVVLMEADFPQGKQLPQAVQAQNDELQAKYKVEGFPTLVLVGPNGKELDRNVGYLEGGPNAMIDWIKSNQKN